MAENSNNIQTTVLQVEVGGAIKSTKEYKEYLDGLKASLLGLEQGTEEYNRVADELRQGQEKLNQVMDVAKGKGEAVEGSYDNLSKTMSALKREWKATGDAAERARLAEKINDINDELKGMDASVGVFTRNVGNYAGAFEDAFKTVLGEIGQTDGALGDLAKNTTQLIPIIQKTTQVATAGLSGIKKAIAATGIGLLIIAVGALASNFDALRKTVGITDEKFQEFKTKVLNVFQNIAAGVFGVGNALIQMLLMPIKNIIDAFATLGNVMGKVFKGQFRQAVSAAKSGIKEISENITKGLNFKANYEEGTEFGAKLIQNIKEGAKEEDATVTVTVKKKEETKLKEVDVSKFDSYGNPQLKARIEEEKRLAKEEADLQKVIADQDKEFYDDLNKQLDEANKEYIQSVIEANEEEERLLKERQDAYFAIAGSIGEILGSISDAWMDTIQAQIDAGEISEEEGKKQFEKIKALQVAEAIINTIAGAVGALMGITKDTGGWGIAAAIAQAAAITAAGMAQVRKIQNTTIGSNTAASIPEVNQVASTNMPTYTQTYTNQNDIDNLANAIGNTMKGVNLSVSVTDIDNAQTTVKTRERESSF